MSASNRSARFDYIFLPCFTFLLIFSFIVCKNHWTQDLKYVMFSYFDYIFCGLGYCFCHRCRQGFFPHYNVLLSLLTHLQKFDGLTSTKQFALSIKCNYFKWIRLKHNRLVWICYSKNRKQNKPSEIRFFSTQSSETF